MYSQGNTVGAQEAWIDGVDQALAKPSAARLYQSFMDKSFTENLQVCG